MEDSQLGYKHWARCVTDGPPALGLIKWKHKTNLVLGGGGGNY